MSVFKVGHKVEVVWSSLTNCEREVFWDSKELIVRKTCGSVLFFEGYGDTESEALLCKNVKKLEVNENV